MEQNNKLIAEFMGCTHPFNNVTDATLYNVSHGTFELSDLRYDVSWDWLMPVVQKIGDEYYNTPFDETYSHLTEQYENIWTLEDTYRAVVEFIKDQNTIKNN
tara:strand:+ start:547 stop:852 length:306 start_codon:yes stop_codon:yes gene_type:complete